MLERGVPNSLPLRAQLALIDWQRPWLAHVAESGRTLAAEIEACASEAAALACMHARLSELAARYDLCNAQALPIRFIPQHALPDGTAYEAHIYATGCVPTRGDLHDFFNALIWLRFPRIKAALNRMQASHLAVAGVQATRGGTRDAATLFDENAVLFVTDALDLSGALQNFAWQTLFVLRRDAWDRHCKVVPFGHALLEKLIMPYKAITAHAWKVLAKADVSLNTLDIQVAHQLHGFTLASSAFSPLPVLGIPGWWSGNDDPRFYADTQVFRPGRSRATLR